MPMTAKSRPSGAPPIEPAPVDTALLDALQRAAFAYFLDHTNAHNGLTADTTREAAPASIAVIVFAWSAYPIGVERGWMDLDGEVRRTFAAPRFFWSSDQVGGVAATGYSGFYFHFLDVQTGRPLCQTGPGGVHPRQDLHDPTHEV